MVSRLQNLKERLSELTKEDEEKEVLGRGLS